MENTFIVVFLKNSKTGFLETELCSLDISENSSFITNIYVMESGGIYKAFMKLSTEKDTEDWEYNAVFDYYEASIYEGLAEVTEVSECFNPTWEFVFDYIESEFEESVLEILKLHKAELGEVYSAIADKKDEYSEEE